VDLSSIWAASNWQNEATKLSANRTKALLSLRKDGLLHPLVGWSTVEAGYVKAGKANEARPELTIIEIVEYK